MLSKNSKNIVTKVINKALNDEDADQMACLKLVIDRILPPEYFTKAKASGNKIEIQILGVDAQVSQVETIDADYEMSDEDE